jgi:peptide/nickel transport system substrate-binding protein
MKRHTDWAPLGGRRPSRRRLLTATGTLAGAAAFLAACGGGEKKETGGGGTSNLPAGQTGATAVTGGGGPKKGGILRVAADFLGAELDIHKTNTPWESNFIWHFAGNFLMRFNKDSLPEPDLATAQPEVTDGGTTLIFKLNPAAKWQQRPPANGRTADSEDVKFTFERIKDPKTASPRAQFFINVEKIETPDPTTAVFKTKAPEADLLNKMSDQYQLIVPKEWAGKDKPVGGAQDVVGTGPYVLDSFVLDQGFKMSRRPDGYWKPNTAWLDGADVRRVDAPDGRAAALRGGQVDWVNIPGDEAKAFESDKSYYVLQSRNATRECLLLNQNKPFYKDVRVRQAIWRAIERKAIYDKVFAGLGIPGGPMTPAAIAWVLPDAELEKLPGFKKDRNAELTEAKQLLTAAGFPDGFEDTMTTVTAFMTNDEADLYVPQVARIGVKYKLENVGTDYNTFLQREIKREYSAAATLFLSGAFPDAQLNQYHYTGASRNYADFSDPKLDAMMDAQSKEFDINKRKQIVFDIQRELINNPPGFMWVGSRTLAYVYRSYYKGFYLGNFLASYSQAESGYLDK